ncbi:hypothetical protein H4R33_005090 [Dimargaris cristalligena]|nr:hypothetical protein H4R33_005090 [Dimargaris cristalligena]
MLADSPYHTLRQFFQLLDTLERLADDQQAQLPGLLQTLLTLLDDAYVARYISHVSPSQWFSSPAPAASNPTAPAIPEPAHPGEGRWLARLFDILLLPTTGHSIYPQRPASLVGDRPLTNYALAILSSPVVSTLFRDPIGTVISPYVDPLCHYIVHHGESMDDMLQCQFLQLLQLMTTPPAGAHFAGQSSAQRAFIHYCMDRTLAGATLAGRPEDDDNKNDSDESNPPPSRLEDSSDDPTEPSLHYHRTLVQLAGHCAAVARVVQQHPRAARFYKALLTHIGQPDSSTTVLALLSLHLLLTHDPALSGKIFNATNNRETWRLIFHIVGRTDSEEDLRVAIDLVYGLLNHRDMQSVIADHPSLIKAVRLTLEHQWKEHERYDEIYYLLSILLEHRINLNEIIDLIDEFDIVAQASSSMERFLRSIANDPNQASLMNISSGSISTLVSDRPDSEIDEWWAPHEYPHLFPFLMAVARIQLENNESLEKLQQVLADMVGMALILQIDRLGDFAESQIVLALFKQLNSFITQFSRTHCGQQAILHLQQHELNRLLEAQQPNFAYSQLQKLYSTLNQPINSDPVATVTCAQISSLTVALWLQSFGSSTVSSLQRSHTTHPPMDTSPTVCDVLALAAIRSTDLATHPLLCNMAQVSGPFYNRYMSRITHHHRILLLQTADHFLQESNQQDQSDFLEQENGRLTAQVTTLQIQLRDTTRTNEELQVEARELERTAKECQTESKVLSRDVDELTSRLQKKNGEMGELKAFVSDLKQEIQIFQEDVAMREERWNKVVRQLRTKTEQLNTAESRLERMTKDHRTLTTENKKLREQVDRIPSLEARLNDELNYDNQQARDENNKLQHRFSGQKEELESLSVDLAREKQTVAQFQSLMRQQREQLEQHEQVAQLMMNIYTKKPRYSNDSEPVSIPETPAPKMDGATATVKRSGGAYGDMNDHGSHYWPNPTSFTSASLSSLEYPHTPTLARPPGGTDGATAERIEPAATPNTVLPTHRMGLVFPVPNAMATNKTDSGASHVGGISHESLETSSRSTSGATIVTDILGVGDTPTSIVDGGGTGGPRARTDGYGTPTIPPVQLLVTSNDR